MTPPKFTPENRAAILDRAAHGVSLADTARALDIRHATLKRWITRGRSETDGSYAEFVDELEQARQQAKDRPEPMDEAELLIVISESARRGSVAAMKLRWEMILDARHADEAEPAANPLAGVDELARQRRTGQLLPRQRTRHQ